MELKEYIKDIKSLENEIEDINSNIYTIKTENNTDFIINKKTNRIDKDYVILISQSIYCIKDNKRNTVKNLQNSNIANTTNNFFKDLQKPLKLTKVEWIDEIDTTSGKDINGFISCSTLVEIAKNGLYKAYEDSGNRDMFIFLYRRAKQLNCEKLFNYTIELFNKNDFVANYGRIIHFAFIIADKTNYNNGKYFLELVKETGILGKYYTNFDIVEDIIYNKDFNLELNRVLEYITQGFVKQGITILDTQILQTYYDYLQMEYEMFGKIKDKYPSYLKTQHDITVNKYNVWKQHKNDLKIFDNSQQNQCLEYKDNNYTIMLPKNSAEILDEAIQQHNCLASYINRIAENQTIVLFMRDNKDLEKSLVTLEIKDNKVKQAKQVLNSKIDKKQKDFLVKWCKEKEINLGCLANKN